jgi:GntR family transcriptional regulator
LNQLLAWVEAHPSGGDLIDAAPDATPDRRQPSRRIADELRALITAGTLAPGDKLPSERVLAEDYGTARNTAREALRLLAEEGLVLAEHGRGVFVRRTPAVVRLGNDRYSRRHRESGLSPFLLECQRVGKTGRFEVLSITRVRPPADVAHRLHLPEDEESVLCRENVFYADANPVQRVTTWIPWSVAEGTGLLDEVVPHPYGIHGVFEDQGHVMTRLREEVTARMPRPDEVTALQLPPGVPVLDVLHTSIDEQGTAYELTRFILRGDTGALFYDAPVE